MDFQTGLIYVTKQWTSRDGLHETKTSRNRVVPISKELKKLLLELKPQGPFEERLLSDMDRIKKHPKGDTESAGKVFTDLVLPRMREWRYGEQARHLRAFCSTINIEQVDFHDLRATFITNLLSEGVALAKVMAIVGHSEIATTNEYLRLAGVDVKKDTTDKLGYYLPRQSEGHVINLFQRQRT